MPTTLLEYRLRIRNGSTLAHPDGTADALVVTSSRSETNPYIYEPPQGDGLQFDPIKGTVRSGSYTVNVIDVITSGTSRVVTTVLTDNTNRQQLLSRRAYVEFRENSGAWQTLIAGYVVGIKLGNALSYQFTIGDSRRVEQTMSLFSSDNSTSFPVRGTLFGGPVTGSPNVNGWNNPFVNRGGWRFRVTAVNGPVVDLTFVNGYLGANGSLTSKWNEVAIPRSGTSVGPTRIDEVATKYAVNEVVQVSVGAFYRFPNLIYRIANTTGAFLYDVTPLGALGATTLLTGGYGGNPHLRAQWNDNPLPSVGQEFFVSCITSPASEESPVYLIGHPVDIVSTIYTANNVTVDAASFAALKAQQGDYYGVVIRQTAPARMIEFIESMTGPFGIGLRVNAAGQIQAFSARIKTATLPSVTVTTAMLRDDGSDAFDNDEGTVVTSVVLESETYASYQPNQEDTSGSRPFDGIAVSKSSCMALNADVSTFSSREIKYTISGMIISTTLYSPQASLYIYGIAGEIFDRYGRGSVGGELRVLRGTGADAVQVGDEIYVQVDQLPNNGKRIGDDPSVGARIMQVVRRTDTPSGPDFRLLDSGVSAQPIQAPTISIAASSASPNAIAAFTITNAATLNATAYINVAVQWANSSTTPTGDGTIFTRYTNGSIPTSSVNLPPVATGSRVWVRARTEVEGRRPSAWTAWTSVLLSAVAAPASFGASSIKMTSVTLTWVNTSSVYPIEVYVAPSGSGPVASEYIVGTLPAGSTTFTNRLLNGPGVSYTAAARYVLPNGGFSTAATVGFVTTSDEEFIYRPAGIAIAKNIDIQDGASIQGVPIAMWPYDASLSIEIERAPDNGSNAPNTSAAVMIAKIPGSTRLFSDTTIPITASKWWYRIRHVLGGFLTSGYTCWKGSTPVAINYELQRPDAVAPVIAVDVSETATDGTLTLNITDVQCRLDVVRFRHRSNNGAWSIWTVDAAEPYTYTQAIPPTGFLDIQYEVYGFSASGQYGILAAGQESFDNNSTASMVSVVGTYNDVGAFVLAVSADTDTASLRVALSSSSQPTLATTQGQTAINSRNYSTTLAGPYASGSTLYVSVLGYTGASGTGTESGLFEYRFTRDAMATQCIAVQAASTATQVVVTVTGTAPNGSPTVQLVAVTGSAALVIGAGAGIGVPVASGSQWTFDRGAPLGQPGGAQFRAVLAGTVSDDDFIEIPEQGRDTTYILARARTIAETATTVTVRVAVLDKYTALSSSIAYLTSGISGVSLSSPQSVTAAVGDTFATPEAAGSFADFVVDRPAPNMPTGRITFTATATGRVADSDAADIQSQTLVPPSLSIATTPSAASFSLAITWDGSIAYTLDGAAQSTTGWTSPRTVTINRNAAGGASKVVAFAVTKNNATTSDSVAIPPQDPVVVTITAFSITYDYANNYIEYNYTLAGLPVSYGIRCFALLNGIGTGDLIQVSSTSTKTIVGSPVPLDSSGSITNNWEHWFEVTDNIAQALATSISLYGTTYEP